MRVFYIFSSLCLLLAGLSTARAAGLEYSADAVINGPQGQSTSIRTYVGSRYVRVDSQFDGQTISQITDTETGSVRVLYPQQHSYMLRSGQPVRTADTAARSPCDRAPEGAHCEHLGNETINGRETDKWQVSVRFHDQQKSSTQWIDRQHGFPIRAVYDDITTELKLLGHETVNGRDTEKWQTTITRADGQSLQLLRWFDPQLNTTIREEMPGGLIQELSNIKIGPQPDEIFATPAGFTLQEIPLMQSSRQGSPPGEQPGNRPGIRDYP